jgi:hypothetical protein
LGQERYASVLLGLASEWRNVREPGQPLLASVGTQVGRRLHLLLEELERGSRRSTPLRLAGAVLVLCVLASVFIEGGRLSPRPVMDHHPSHHARHLHP